jgi:hypothetical protein
MAARVSKPNPFLHVRQLAVTDGHVTVTCSQAHCDFTATVPAGPNGAQAVFAVYNKHLTAVAAQA